MATTTLMPSQITRMDDPHETMRTALSSRIFSHVMIVCAHRYAGRNIKYRENILKAIELCKEMKVTPILTRWLYPGSNIGDFTYEDAFSHEYYIREIKNLQEEAAQYGIELVAFDAEPYANKPLKDIKRRKLSANQMEALSGAIEQAVKVAGRVDFVLPAGSRFGKHLYNCTRRLGKFTISEYTYYDIPSTHTEKAAERRPYDIFGAYVGVNKQDKPYTKRALFAPREILERQDLWAHKKGLFIYPGSVENAAAIALEFSKIKTVYTVRDSNDVN